MTNDKNIHAALDAQARAIHGLAKWLHKLLPSGNSEDCIRFVERCLDEAEHALTKETD